MQKIIKLTLLTLILTSATMFAQEVNTENTESVGYKTILVEVEVVKKEIPLSRIGGTLGLNIPDENYDNGIGINAFFHQTLSRSWFLSVNASYHRYTYTVHSGGNKIEAVLTDIPFTLGINAFLAHSGVRPYLGFELGFSFKRAEASITAADLKASDRNTDLRFGPVIGLSVPNLISKKITLEANVKFNWDPNKAFSTGFNLGVAYLLP